MEIIQLKESTKSKFIRDLFKVSKECIESTPAYVNGSVISDPFQSFNHLRFEDRGQDHLLDLFKRTLISCEGAHAYSARIILEICAHLHDLQISDVEKCKEISRSLFENSRRSRLSKLDLKDLWIQSTEGKVLDSDWIDLLKIDSSFECKLTKGTKSQASVRKGHLFKRIRLHDSFGGLTKIQSDNCDVILIDGNVETEGEIFSLVETYRASGRFAFLVAAGFSQSVAVHLLKNYMMGSFKVIPLICATQDDPIGVMVDASCALDADILSAAKGDTISGSYGRCLRQVTSVKATGTGVIFVVKETSSGARSRINELQKILSACDDSARIYVSERISSLRGSMVNLSISELDNSKNPGLVSRIDSFMRSLQPASKMGLVDLFGKKYPLLSARESILAFSSFMECLRSTQVILEVN